MKKIFKLLIIVLVVHSVPAAAEVTPVGTPSQGWTKWSMNLDESKPPRGTGLSQDEFEKLLDSINNIGILFRSIPSLNNPSGVEVSPSRNILKRVGAKYIGRKGIKSTDTRLSDNHPLQKWPVEGKGPVRGEFSIRIFRPEFSYRNPSCSMRVQLNDPWLEGRLIFEDTEGGIYLTWPEESTTGGRRLFRTDKKTVVEKILPPGREPWIPVSQQRWIKLLISKSEQTLRERREMLTDSAGERRKRFNQSYEMMKSLNAEQAEKGRENFESTEKIYARQAAALAAGNYDALEEAGERGLAMVGRHLIALRAELAGMIPAQRSAAAYGFEYTPLQYWMPRKPPKRASLLLEKGDENALPLLTPNPDFFRKDLAATEIQSITIINRLWDEYDSAVNAELNWNKLKAMVK